MRETIVKKSTKNVLENVAMNGKCYENGSSIDGN